MRAQTQNGIFGGSDGVFEGCDGLFECCGVGAFEDEVKPKLIRAVKPAQKTAPKAITREFAARRNPRLSVAPTFQLRETEAFDLAPSVFAAPARAKSVFQDRIDITEGPTVRRKKIGVGFKKVPFETIKKMPEFVALSSLGVPAETLACLGQCAETFPVDQVPEGADVSIAFRNWLEQCNQRAAAAEPSFLNKLFDTIFSNSDKILDFIGRFRGEQTTDQNALMAEINRLLGSGFPGQLPGVTPTPAASPTTPSNGDKGDNTFLILAIAGGGLFLITIMLLVLTRR
jgi:hypothetical protein